MSKKNEYIFKGLLKTDKYDYIINIRTLQYTKNGETVVYSRYFNLGAYISESGEKKTCVDIYVMYPELENELPFINYKLAKLITTHYNEKCSVNEKLERGEGTRHMINTAMYFVSKMCPFIEGFEINDTCADQHSLDPAKSWGDVSTRQCDNNTTIILSYFSITQYGKTWYERNFEAYIGDIFKNKKHNKNQQDNSKKEKTKMELYREIVDNLMIQKLSDFNVFKVLYLTNTKKDIQTELELLYNESKTYGELFKKIHKLGISKACIYLQPWIDNLMLSTDLRNYVMYTQWIIPVESIKRVLLINYKKEFSGKLENYKEE